MLTYAPKLTPYQAHDQGLVEALEATIRDWTAAHPAPEGDSPWKRDNRIQASIRLTLVKAITGGGPSDPVEPGHVRASMLINPNGVGFSAAWIDLDLTKPLSPPASHEHLTLYPVKMVWWGKTPVPVGMGEFFAGWGPEMVGHPSLYLHTFSSQGGDSLTATPEAQGSDLGEALARYGGVIFDAPSYPRTKVLPPPVVAATSG